MLYVFFGTDREKTRTEMNKAVRAVKNAEVVRISDANSPADLSAALSGGGMFGGERVVVLDGVLANEEMREWVIARIAQVCDSCDIFMLEEKIDAETRKKLEKHAKVVKKFDAVKEKERGSIFSLGDALKGGDKKKLWVEYQRALARDEAPEAIHGVLFWAAKDMLLRAKASSPEQSRGAKLVADLAELPHEARRRSFDLEYALERYILDVNKS